MIRVLHSIPPPGSNTTYASHMDATRTDEVEPIFFSWSRALAGRYEVFHLHWPEHLLGTRPGARRWFRLSLVFLLIARLRIRDTPIVRTVHNLAPHDLSTATRSYRLVEGLLDRLTRVDIHLIEEPSRQPDRQVIYIPHGDYRLALGHHPRQQVEPGRLLFFGLLKSYKGLSNLLEAFKALDDDRFSLTVAGKPIDDTTVAIVEAARSEIHGVTVILRFLSDAELVEQVSCSQLVVLPYDHLHSSGAVLVALSLGRPVFIPAGAVADQLRAEVGDEWVHTFTPPLDAVQLRYAAERSLSTPPSRSPRLVGRSWTDVAQRHRDAYASAIRHTTSRA